MQRGEYETWLFALLHEGAGVESFGQEETSADECWALSDDVRGGKGRTLTGTFWIRLSY